MFALPPSTRATRIASRVSATFVVLALAACGGGGGDKGGNGPVAGTPAHIDIVGTPPTGAVNTVVSPAPGVKLTDAAGLPVPGVQVTFAANGGGSLTGASQISNGDGIATVGSWKLGTASGSGNVLTATAGTLTTTITATATAGPAVSHLALATLPDSQLVAPAGIAPYAPSVRVADAYGNGVSGTIVTFAAGQNSGTVTGGLQTTDANGVATVGRWTTGSAVGRQTLQATVAGGTLPPVAFVANALQAADPCSTVAHALVSYVGASLATGDCAFPDGTFLDLYSVTSTQPVNHEFRLASDAIDAYVYVYNAAGEILGIVDDANPPSTDAAIRFIGPAGTYVIGASSYDIGETGAYKLRSVAGAIPAGCAFNAYVAPGASWSESIAPTDCQESAGAGGSGHGDEYGFVLYPGRSVVVTMRSAALDSYLTVLRASGQQLVAYATDNNSGGGTDARVTISNTATGATPTLFVIVAGGNLVTSAGAYTLDITAPPAPALAAAPTRTSARAMLTAARANVQLLRPSATAGNKSR